MKNVPFGLPYRAVAFRLFLTCWVIYALHFATNTVREIYPALSLGDHLSFDVSEYKGLHPDIFELPGKGVFINNNPGASILGAVPYLMARPLIDRVVRKVEEYRRQANQAEAPYDTHYPMAREFHREARERGLDIKFGLAAAVMQALLMAPLSALSVVLMFFVLLPLSESPRLSLLLALLFAFATPIFYRTAQLNQNLLLAHFGFFAFTLLWRPWDDSSSPKAPRYFVAGLFCGLCVLMDYSGVVTILGIAVYVMVRRARLPVERRFAGDLWRFALGAAIPVAILMGYQWSCFGSPLFPAQHYMPDATYTHRGYQGMDWPQIGLLWETAFGMRYGLFISAPVLLLALFFPCWASVEKSILPRAEAFFAVAFSIAFFIFCSMNQYGYMQFNTGVRHVVPVTPFVFLLVATVIAKLPKLSVALVSVAGVYWSWCLSMYRDVEQGLGVFEAVMRITLEGFRLPWLTTLARMGYLAEASPLPLFMLVAAFLFVIWKAFTASNFENFKNMSSSSTRTQ